MHQFLIPVDFSNASAHALRFAYSLNKHFFARLQILHLFDVPITSGDDSELYLKNYEAYRKSFDDELWDFVKTNKGDFHYETEVFSTSGGHYQGIIEFSRKHHSELIIIGHKGAGGLRRWLFGSVSRYLLTHPPIPVLSIPESFNKPDFKRIVLTTDMSMMIPEQQCIFLQNFAERLGAKLEIIHVKDKGEISLPVEEKIQASLKKYFEKDVQIISVKSGETISSVINHYIQENNIDLLVTVPHFHTWIDRMLIGSETKELASIVNIPLMSLPGK
jgi:nucleotide-binding universal stress UspA family protein